MLKEKGVEAQLHVTSVDPVIRIMMLSCLETLLDNV